jgi:hypothetical protein
MRRTYLAALAVLQLALAIAVAPPLSGALRANAAIVDAPDLAAAVLRLAIVGVAMVGSAFALAGPLLALLRHHQRGRLRFQGLPQPAVAATIGGAALIGVTGLVTVLIEHAGVSAPAWVDDLLPAAVDAAIAATVGGAICAEMLRRSVAPPRLIGHTVPPRLVTVQVVAPEELRTLPV